MVISFSTYFRYTNTISIVITDYDFIPETGRCHTVFRMLEQEEHFPFNELMEINVLNLARLPEDEEGRLMDWLRFLKAEREEEFKMLAAKNPLINEAYCKLPLAIPGNLYYTSPIVCGGIMSKRLPFFCVLFLVLSALYGQNSANPVSRLDGAVKSLAGDIAKRFPAGENPKIAAGTWIYGDSIPALSAYWGAQLTEELTNIPVRSFILVSGGAADWIISGEIANIAGVIRVYTRLLRAGDHSIMAGFHSDFELDEIFNQLLSGSGNGGASFPANDIYETDDDFALAKDIQLGTAQRHTFTTGEDIDWVKFQITRAGPYTIRTRGVNSNGLDTYIELYDENRNVIDDDDDGGESLDSRLSVRLQEGTYYLKVESLDDEPGAPYTIRIDAD